MKEEQEKKIEKHAETDIRGKVRDRREKKKVANKRITKKKWFWAKTIEQ